MAKLKSLKLSTQKVIPVLVVLAIVLVGIYYFSIKNSADSCKNGYVKHSYHNNGYNFLFCSPSDKRTEIQGNENATPGNNIPSFSVVSKNPYEYIQGQLLLDSQRNFREDFYHRNGLGKAAVKVDKLVALRDEANKFIVLERRFNEPRGKLETFITAYVTNPYDEKQIMRIWYFYDDEDSFDQVRAESKLFTDLIDSFRWNK